MRGCAVVSCPNCNVKTSNNVTYHRFPADEEIRKKWLEKCGRNLQFDCSRSRVCSEHFTSDDFERDLQGELLGQPLKKRLKKGVEPHLNIVAIKQEPLDPEETVDEHPGLIRVERVFPVSLQFVINVVTVVF
ncbi:THAP domain-containing protein 1-like [Stegodyphus dumicola]|uniref:THAP domain-containing protein 1-like n=1 Tax=Stegodyphus dumicola TaxID=202533 RepID=UPI0015ABE533|nr:THAP domain-containing protein 1-like [Stegodyphus dumicola]